MRGHRAKMCFAIDQRLGLTAARARRYIGATGLRSASTRIGPHRGPGFVGPDHAPLYRHFPDKDDLIQGGSLDRPDPGRFGQRRPGHAYRGSLTRRSGRVVSAAAVDMS